MPDRNVFVAFEPDERECAKVNVKLGNPHKCLPYFVGDGTERTFFQTNMTMTGSLYPPNRKVVDKYAHLGEVMQLVATHRVKTARLDEVIEVGDADLLKMDVQGAEVDVLRVITRSINVGHVVHDQRLTIRGDVQEALQELNDRHRVHQRPWIASGRFRRSRCRSGVPAHRYRTRADAFLSETLCALVAPK